ncbi:MAG: 50S ribosomal protein L31e [Candidatus Bathyarchaeia archaeon]
MKNEEDETKVGEKSEQFEQEKEEIGKETTEEQQMEKEEEATEEELEELLKEEEGEEEKEESLTEAEEEKPTLKEKEKEEEEIVEERFYTIPLAKAFIVPPNKRAAKAIRIIRDFVKRHMKLEAGKEEGEEEEEAEPKRLIISNEVNEKVWSRGIEKPPRKIRIRAAKDKDGNVTVYLAEGD